MIDSASAQTPLKVGMLWFEYSSSKPKFRCVTVGREGLGAREVGMFASPILLYITAVAYVDKDIITRVEMLAFIPRSILFSALR